MTKWICERWMECESKGKTPHCRPHEYNYLCEIICERRPKFKAKCIPYIPKWQPIKEEKMEKEYKYVAPCVVNILGMQGKKPCKEDFRKACIEWLNMGYNLADDIEIEHLISVANKYNGIKWLIDEGFIKEKEPEVFFKVGDEFKWTCGTAKLHKISQDEVRMIPDDPKVYHPHDVRVSDSNKITKKEFKEICGPIKFKKIERH